MPIYRYLQEEISASKIIDILGVSPTIITVGDIELEGIETPNGRLSVYRKGVEIDFPNAITTSQLAALDNFLKSKNLTRQAVILPKGV